MKGLPLPTFETDEEAERFVAEADLSEYDLSGAKPMQFVLRTPPGYERARALITSGALDRAVQQAQRKGVTLDRYLGELIERALEPTS